MNNELIDIFDDLESIQRKSHSIARSKFLSSSKYKEMSFEDKVIWSKNRIKEFFQYCDENDVVPEVSFSGGKDSSVLLHLVREIRGEIMAVILGF